MLWLAALVLEALAAGIFCGATDCAESAGLTATPLTSTFGADSVVPGGVFCGHEAKDAARLAAMAAGLGVSLETREARRGSGGVLGAFCVAVSWVVPLLLELLLLVLSCTSPLAPTLAVM